VTDIRVPAADEWPAVAKAMHEGFADDFHQETADTQRKIFEPERSLIGVDGEQIVSTTGIFTRDLGVPGDVVPAAHVSMVTVAPTHRRQGILSAMMRRQLSDIRRIGTEPIAVLWASEGTIYQRFGYGLASLRVSYSIDLTQVRLNRPPAAGLLRNLSKADALPIITSVYEQVWRQRPGFSSRNSIWWEHLLDDIEKGRGGATAMRFTMALDATGEPDGYAIWRTRPAWSDAGPDGRLNIIELVTAGPDAYARLWHFLLSMDLVRTADMWLGGVAEPLVHLVNEPRRLGAGVGDGLWVRIVDLPGAIGRRRYLGDFDVVVEVTDALIPENAGRWRLTALDGRGRSEPTADAAVLQLDIADLGAIYLGGTSLSTLVRAGRVVELQPDAAASMAAGFGWPLTPQSIEIF
jgi:predicted acetyltransferase